MYTSDIKGAGTDANVTAVLFGSNKRDTGPIKLETSKNNFERGQEDIFYTEFPDLGDVVEVEIGHDNSGFAPGWHCEQVVVVDETANQRYAFPCDRCEAGVCCDGDLYGRRALGFGASWRHGSTCFSHAGCDKKSPTGSVLGGISFSHYELHA